LLGLIGLEVRLTCDTCSTTRGGVQALILTLLFLSLSLSSPVAGGLTFWMVDFICNYSVWVRLFSYANHTAPHGRSTPRMPPRMNTPRMNTTDEHTTRMDATLHAHCCHNALCTTLHFISISFHLHIKIDCALCTSFSKRFFDIVCLKFLHA
jgi:hypothetical protein